MFELSKIRITIRKIPRQKTPWFGEVHDEVKSMKVSIQHKDLKGLLSGITKAVKECQKRNCLTAQKRIS